MKNCSLPDSEVAACQTCPETLSTSCEHRQQTAQQCHEGTCLMVLETMGTQVNFLLIHSGLSIDKDLTATQPQRKHKDHKWQLCVRNYQTMCRSLSNPPITRPENKGRAHTCWRAEDSMGSVLSYLEPLSKTTDFPAHKRGHVCKASRYNAAAESKCRTLLLGELQASTEG